MEALNTNYRKIRNTGFNKKVQDRELREPLLLDRVPERPAEVGVDTRLDRRRGRSCEFTTARWSSANEGGERADISQSGTEHRVRNISSSVGLRGVSISRAVSGVVVGVVRTVPARAKGG